MYPSQKRENLISNSKVRMEDSTAFVLNKYIKRRNQKQYKNKLSLSELLLYHNMEELWWNLVYQMGIENICICVPLSFHLDVVSKHYKGIVE